MSGYYRFVVRSTRISFFALFLFLASFIAAIILNIVFGFGWELGWKDVKGLSLMLVFITVLYGAIQLIFSFFGASKG